MIHVKQTKKERTMAKPYGDELKSLEQQEKLLLGGCAAMLEKVAQEIKDLIESDKDAARKGLDLLQQKEMFVRSIVIPMGALSSIDKRMNGETEELETPKEDGMDIIHKYKELETAMDKLMEVISKTTTMLVIEAIEGLGKKFKDSPN